MQFISLTKYLNTYVFTYLNENILSFWSDYTNIPIPGTNSQVTPLKGDDTLCPYRHAGMHRAVDPL